MKKLSVYFLAAFLLFAVSAQPQGTKISGGVRTSHGKIRYSTGGSTNLDQYGGLVDKTYTGAVAHSGFWNVVKWSNNRWTLTDPLNHPLWLFSTYNMQSFNLAKYGGSATTYFAQAAIRLKYWGMNATGEESDIRMFPTPVGPNAQQLAFLHVMNEAYYTVRDSKVKNLYSYVPAGTVGGNFPDVYDPNWAPSVQAGFTSYNSGVFNGQMNTTLWMVGISTDDGDYTTGFGPGPAGAAISGKCAPHLGWVAIVLNPVGAATFSGTSVYTKLAIRDYLSAKYTTISALNTAWGSNYTTFDASGAGWGVGTGLLDEKGQHSWIGTETCYLTSIPAAVKADLDTFLGQLATQYFSAYRAGLNAVVPNRLLFSAMPMQGGCRSQIITAAGNYVDAIQGSGVPTLEDDLFKAMYDQGGRPIFLWSTFTSQADSDLVSPPAGWGPTYDYATQGARGNAYASYMPHLFGLLSTSGTDAFILGIDWWSWADKVGSGENMNFGFVTVSDDNYDSHDDVTATVTCSAPNQAYSCGGEAANHGDFLTSVKTTNQQILQSLLSSLP